jgi:hypothetical protein
VIHEIDEALRTLIRQEVVPGGEAEIVFDAPTTEWAARRSALTIDVYLYDIREDVRRRTVGTIEARAERLVTSRQRTPRFFRLSYLITAWTQRPEDEHRLLSTLLERFVQHEVVPPDLLGALADGPPVGISLALPPSEDRALSDIWSSLGGELKPSIDLVVTAPLPFTPSTEVAPPVLESPTVVVRPGDHEAVTARKGRGRAKGQPAPVGPGARSTVRRGGRVVTVVDRAAGEPDDDG